MKMKNLFKSRYRMRMILFLLLCVLCLLYVKISGTVQQDNISNSETSSGNLQVHFLDVGHGDATLVKCGNHAMLIDAGDDTKGTMIQKYLKECGVEKLDYFILTHPDKDHIGGAPVILTKYKIGDVMCSYYKKESTAYKNFENVLRDRNITYEVPNVGDMFRLGDASFVIIAPNREYTDTKAESNNSSIGLLITYGKNRFLFTGDAEKEAEQDIVENGIDIKADVYQVGHHGSKTSTSKRFMKKVKPAYAVISCEKGNENGQPHQKTLDILKKMEVKVYRTDEQGTIVATSDGTTITWNYASKPRQTEKVR